MNEELDRRSLSRPPADGANPFPTAALRLQTWLAAVPTRAYLLLLLVAAIGLSLLLCGDFGRSWDVAVREAGAVSAHIYYSKGFDSAWFRASQTPQNLYHGTVVDILIGYAQQAASNEVQRLAIRVFLQALLSLSCLIPVFLICERVFSRPLALIAAVLVGTTPAFFGHAFINPKDSVFASGFLWALYLILYLFDRVRRPGYAALVGLGVLLGVVVSLRFSAAYLLLLVPLVAILLPALRPADEVSASEERSFTARLREQVALHYRGLGILILTFIVAYVLAMPGILSDLRPHALLQALHMFGRYPWDGTVLYFGKQVSAQKLPWHYLYGYWLVQLPLYYHLFLLTIVASLVALPRATLRAFADLYRRDYDAFSVVIVLLAALIFPLAVVLLKRPVLYDGLRHLLFVVPLLCLLLYLGFVGVMASMARLTRAALVVLGALCWFEAVVAMHWLHPYEYAYYNPLVNPAGAFELDYWATSFREVAERLNDYAREHGKPGEKLRLRLCNGPASSLAPYLDADRFEIVEAADAVELTVALNRGPCLATLKDVPWLFSVKRGDLVFAVVAPN